MIIGLESLLLYIGLVLIVSVAILLLTWVLGGRHQARAKNVVYESGINPTGSARIRFPIRFYLIALFFLLFDLEVAFILIWAYVYKGVGWWGFWNITIFILLLLAGLIYPWLKGAFDFAPAKDRRLTQ